MRNGIDCAMVRSTAAAVFRSLVVMSPNQWVAAPRIPLNGHFQAASRSAQGRLLPVMTTQRQWWKADFQKRQPLAPNRPYWLSRLMTCRERLGPPRVGDSEAGYQPTSDRKTAAAVERTIAQSIPLRTVKASR